MSELSFHRCPGKFGDDFEYCDYECNKCPKKLHVVATNHVIPYRDRKTLKQIEEDRSNKDHWDNYSWYKPVDAACSKCGGQLYINDSVILTSYPPQYQYVCQTCGNVETSHIQLPYCYE